MWSILMRFGIGTPSVTTTPPQSVRVGEPAEVTVQLEGGKADMEDPLFVAVETEYEKEGEEGTYDVETTLQKEKPLGEVPLGSGESRTETVQVTVPLGTPVTHGSTKVWIDAGLDVSWGADPSDWTYVEVQPSVRMQRVFDAMEELGFTLTEAKPEAAPSGVFSSGSDFIQEFEYVPRGGPYQGQLDELELIFDPTPDALGVTAEVDRDAGMLSEMAGTDESKDQMQVRDQNHQAVVEQLSNLIDRNL